MIGRQASVSLVAYPNLSKQDRFTCICCRIKFESTELQRAHFKSEWHLYNLKRKICNLDPIDLESFEAIQTTSPAHLQDDNEASSSSASSFVDLSMKSPDKTRLSDLDEDEDDDEWVCVDGDEFSDEEYDEDELNELLTHVIKTDTCLFCDKKSSNSEDNINHMELAHGFFIPEQQYIIDLQGLMEYLGFKVGAGATCLWCNKQFTSVHGVRLHMIYKDHCKILYNQDIAVKEFKEFYDYSAQKQFEMKPITELVTYKRRFERKSTSDDSFVKTQSPFSDDFKKAMSRRDSQPGTFGKLCQAKTHKKFNAYRAKIMLKTVSSNNRTMRSRFRHQNPI